MFCQNLVDTLYVPVVTDRQCNPEYLKWCISVNVSNEVNVTNDRN